MQDSPFHTFWMGGYECADHLNAFGHRVDLLHATAHLAKIEEDYAALAALGIRTVREGIRWSLVEKQPYFYDFASVETVMHAAKKQGIQVIWDICHFGYPDDLTPLHPMFARRFTAVCAAFVNFYRGQDADATLIITPINEVSFISWLGGDARGTSPYCTRQGWEVKYALCKAYIEGIETMKLLDASIKILTTEPLIHIAAQLPEHTEAAKARNDEQFQVTDILTGKICPELRGHSALIDYIGVNFYYNNQSVYETGEVLPWNDHPPHPLWKPLSVLVAEVQDKYGKPVIISETSHPLEDRPVWIEMIAREAETLAQQHAPLAGICIYPVIDRPDWDFHHWHRSGIWDIHPDTMERTAYIPYREALERIILKQ